MSLFDLQGARPFIGSEVSYIGALPCDGVLESSHIALLQSHGAKGVWSEDNLACHRWLKFGLTRQIIHQYMERRSSQMTIMVLWKLIAATEWLRVLRKR